MIKPQFSAKTLIYSKQFLHRQIMSIFTNQYQYDIEIPSSIQDDGGVCKMTGLVVLSLCIKTTAAPAKAGAYHALGITVPVY
jgi:hypothetical protein